MRFIFNHKDKIKQIFRGKIMSASHSVSAIEKAAYIRTTYDNLPGLRWEEKLRDSIQLVSDIIPGKSKEEVNVFLTNMLEREVPANKAAFHVVASRSGSGVRIIVNLNDFKDIKQIPTLEQIINFLNNVHAPFVVAAPDLPLPLYDLAPLPQKSESKAETVSFQCEWEVQQDRVAMIGPSLHYDGPIGHSVKDALQTQFSETAKSVGFDDAFIVLFNKNLISKDHKFSCHHCFENPDFIAQLGKLAKHFEKMQCRHYAEKATAGAFSTKLPESLGLHVLGKFASVSDAARLACVNRKARAEAKAGKELDDEKASQKVTMKPGK